MYSLAPKHVLHLFQVLFFSPAHLYIIYSPESAINYGETLEQTGQTKDPTLFGPFAPDTSLYAEPMELPTDETIPWRPLNVSFGTVRPLELFRLAADRVLERIQLVSPRLTWNYLERRRSIRRQWMEIALHLQDNVDADGMLEYWRTCD
jgi:hypothetical protein